MLTPAEAPSSDLRATLLRHAIEVTRTDGPDALSLREVQRRSGVSPAAAYRHYQNRQALLAAVGHHASRTLSDRVARAQEAVTSGDTPAAAVERLRAGCRAYLDFAADEPGLSRALLLGDESPAVLVDPPAAARGSDGWGAFELLRACLEDLARHHLMDPRALAWSDTAVWSACHGLSVLLVDTPLRHLDDEQREAVTARLIDVLLHGLLAPGTAAAAGPGASAAP